MTNDELSTLVAEVVFGHTVCRDTSCEGCDADIAVGEFIDEGLLYAVDDGLALGAALKVCEIVKITKYNVPSKYVEVCWEEGYDGDWIHDARGKTLARALCFAALLAIGASVMDDFGNAGG